MDNDTLIKVEDLCKIYNPGENEVRALDHVSLEIKKGELVAKYEECYQRFRKLYPTLTPLF